MPHWCSQDFENPGQSGAFEHFELKSAPFSKNSPHFGSEVGHCPFLPNPGYAIGAHWIPKAWSCLQSGEMPRTLVFRRLGVIYGLENYRVYLLFKGLTTLRELISWGLIFRDFAVLGVFSRFNTSKNKEFLVASRKL